MISGAGTLARSIFRRDRVRMGIWTVALAGLALYAVVAFESLYASAEDLQGYAAVVETSPAARAFSGPGYGLADPILGAVVTNDTLGFMAAAMGLMSIFLISRNTRAEEESGAAELVAASGAGRHARSAAAFGSLVVLNLVIGATVAMIWAVLGLGLAGSIVFGLAVAATGMLFAAVALLGAQLSPRARVGTTLAGLVLALSYLLRALGDVQQSDLSWLSPIGWAQATRPFAGEQVLPFILLLGSTVLITALAIRLESRRDIGSGLLTSKPGPAHGRSYMARSFGLPLRLLRISIASWVLGAAVLGFTYGTVATDVQSVIDENPSFAEYLTTAAGNLIDSYFVTVLAMLGLVAAGYSIQVLVRMRSEELSGRAEPLLATGVSRARWAIGYALVLAAGAGAIILIGGSATGLGYVVVGGPAGEVGNLALAAAAQFPAVIALSGVVACLIGFVPRLAVAAWVYLGFCFFVAFFGQALDLPEWIRRLSPFEHTPQVPVEQFEVAPLAALGAVGIGLAGLALVGLRRRDIG